jgi:hypothetical protein
LTGAPGEPSPYGAGHSRGTAGKPEDPNAIPHGAHLHYGEGTATSGQTFPTAERYHDPARTVWTNPKAPGILRKLFSRKSKTGELPEAPFIHIPGVGKNAKGAILKPNSPGFTSKAAAIAHIEQQRNIWNRARAVPGPTQHVPTRGLARLRHPFKGYKEVRSTHFQVRFDEMPPDESLVEVLDYNENHDPITGEFASTSVGHTALASAAVSRIEPPADHTIRNVEEAKARVSFQQEQLARHLKDLQQAQKLIEEQKKKWDKAKIKPVPEYQLVPGAGFFGGVKKIKTYHYTISHDSNSLVSDDLIDMVLIDEEGDSTMSVTLTIDSIPVETTEIGATVIKKELDKLAKLTTDAATAAATAAATIAKKDEALVAKDAEIAVLTKKLADSTLTPQQKDEAVRERYETVNKAQAILGDRLVTDGKTDAEIRRQVVDDYMGGTAKTFTDEHVSAAFVVITKDAAVKPVGSARSLADSIRFAAPVMDARTKALADRDEYMRNAWKTPAKTA